MSHPRRLSAVSSPRLHTRLRAIPVLPLCRSVTENPIRLQFVHTPQAADFFKVFPMIFSARNIGVHVLGESRRALGVIDVEPQMIRVEVIALENRSRMGAKGLVYDRFNPVGWNDGLLREPPDIFGRH